MNVTQAPSGVAEWLDTPLKAAIRAAFDNPTIANIEAVARAASLHLDTGEAPTDGFSTDDYMRSQQADTGEATPAPPEWQPIETAPKDGTLFLSWAPAREGLPAMYSLCAWHPDAGFCIDEIREASIWTPLPSLPSESAKEQK